jgi:sterol O-acyltransferase
MGMLTNRCRLEFSREWNIPVHHFLRRHVYGASRPYVSKGMATALTFLTSALLHELVMGCITKKLRGYGFVAMMLQLPIVAVQRTSLVRGRTLFNNIGFWISMILGLSIASTALVMLSGARRLMTIQMCALYVLV